MENKMDKQEILIAAIRNATTELVDYASSAENTDQNKIYSSIASSLNAALIMRDKQEMLAALIIRDKQEILIAAIRLAITELVNYTSSAENTDQIKTYSNIASSLNAALATFCQQDISMQGIRNGQNT
jgi:hypothetical protein